MHRHGPVVQRPWRLTVGSPDENSDSSQEIGPGKPAANNRSLIETVRQHCHHPDRFRHPPSTTHATFLPPSSLYYPMRPFFRHPPSTTHATLLPPSPLYYLCDPPSAILPLLPMRPSFSHPPSTTQCDPPYEHSSLLTSAMGRNGA